MCKGHTTLKDLINNRKGSSLISSNIRKHTTVVENWNLTDVYVKCAITSAVRLLYISDSKPHLLLNVILPAVVQHSSIQNKSCFLTFK